MNRLCCAVLMGGLVFSYLGLQSLAQGTALTVAVTNGASTTTLSKASILVRSSKGYALGSGDQDFGGIYVTDPVVPPEGIELQRTLVKWSELREVEFTDWNFEPRKDARFSRAKLTLQDSSSREVFVWNPTGSSSWYRLDASSITIKGSLVLEGKEQAVEMKPANLKKLAFSKG